MKDILINPKQIKYPSMMVGRLKIYGYRNINE